jgi:hypothetical protein
MISKLIKEAGIVNTYFQFASQIKCMKKEITNVAFMQEIAIITVQLTTGMA